MNTKVTIGLCVKNASCTIKFAFNSIATQDYPHEFLKLVIVDNGSIDNTLSLALEFAKQTDIRTLVVSSKGKGLGASRQMAVDNAEGDYIVWVDDDYILQKDFIRKQTEFMDKNPNVGAARGLHIQNSSSTLVGSLAIAGFVLPSWNLPNPETIGTGGAIFRLKAIERVRGFDIQIKGAGEDQDISQRIRESGWPLATNVSVGVLKKKQGETTLRSLWKHQIWYGYGNHFLFHKFKNQKMLLDYNPPYALLYGFITSKRIYHVTKKKNVFFFTILYPFIKTAQFLGFIRAHLDGYGHVTAVKTKPQTYKR
ncbi:MAG: glycosyltransferase family A protein [Candidatus Bathyarchaeia archaeon]